MSVSDADFANWIKRDNADRVVLVEMDYQHEESGAPVTETLRFATKPYFDDARGLAYRDCINSAPQFSRALSGERLGDYKSTLGTIEIDNADGDFDDVLRWAIDGSEVRCYLGDSGWLRDDFRLIFAAMSTWAKATSIDRISVQLKDAATLLNVSIGGTVLVGGSGTNAAKERPANFGWLHQIECMVLDQTALVYVHSDRGDNTVAVTVRDRGVDITSNASDNGDGTFTLSATPDGNVTADVLAVAPGSAPGDYTQRRMSDAFAAFVGDRAGFSLAGRYLGAGPTYSSGDDDDYFVGISLPQATNVLSLLSQMADSGNCFWAITRGGLFTFGRLNPQDIASLGTVPVEIGEDDVDYGSVKVDHAQPLYYKFQAVINKNWSIQSDLATSLTPDERAGFLNAGINVVQDDSVGTLYADSPELYDLTLAVSPVITTLVSAGYDEDATAIITEWMERRRFMYLPWIETLTIVVGIEFYALELGDVVNFTFPRFGCDDGVLFQVVGTNIDLTKAKITLQLLRRHEAEAIPDGWVRDTTSETPLDIGFAAVPVTVGEPPGTPQPPRPSIGQASWYPGNLPGMGGYSMGLSPFSPASFTSYCFVVDGFTDANGASVTSHAMDVSSGTTWTINDGYGPGVSGEFEIQSNLLRRTSGSTGEALVYPGGNVSYFASNSPDETVYSVEIVARWSDVTDSSYVGLITYSQGPGANHDVQFIVGVGVFPGGTSPNNVAIFNPSGTKVEATLAISIDTDYTLRIDVYADRVTGSVDGTAIGTVLTTQATRWPVGVDVYDASGVSCVGVDYYHACTIEESPTFLLDAFSGSGALSAHTTDSGHSWAPAAGLNWDDGGDIVDLSVSGGAMVPITTDYGSALSSCVPPSADYFIEAQLRFDSVATQNNKLILCGRWIDTPGSGVMTGYQMQLPASGTTFGVWLYLFNGDDGTALTHVDGLPIQGDLIVRFSLSGSNLEVLVNGASVLSCTDSTVSSANSIAFWAQEVELLKFSAGAL